MDRTVRIGLVLKVPNGVLEFLGGFLLIFVSRPKSGNDPDQEEKAKRHEDWELEDPGGKDLAAVRRIWDEIRSVGEDLVTSLPRPHGTTEPALHIA